MRKSFGVFLLMGACLLSFVVPAQAALILSGDIDGVPGFCATDNNIGPCVYGVMLTDNDPAVGVLDIGTASVGGLVVNGSIHTATFGPPYNLLDSTSLSIINAVGGAGTVNVEASISATGFTAPSGTANTTGSGTWGQDSIGSSTTYTYFVDGANTQGGAFGTDRPGVEIDTFTDTADSLIDSYSHNGGPFAINQMSAFSMTLGFDLTLLDGDSLISRGQSAITDVQAVPEPMTMFLVGTGLVGGISRLRRRQQKA